MRESQQMSQMTQNQSWESSTAADEQEEDISCDESNSNNTVSLKPTIGLFGSVMIIVGTIIGSGIFVSPGGVHHCVESVGWSLVIWIVCGLFSAVGAYCYAELGTFIRESGGDYAYVLAAFGPLCGFLRMWIESIIIRPCSNAAVAITFATYILQPFYAADCPPPSHAVQLLAAAAILLLSLFNCKSVPFVTWIQDVFTVAKLCALALIIITGMVLLIHGAPYRDSFANAFVLPEDLTIGKIAMAFYFGLWAYDGWNYLNFITEEMLNPLRDLPWAIFISCAICTLFYVLVNIAFYAGTSPKEFVDSKAIAVTFANKFYGPLAFTMPIMVAASCFGSINGVMLTSSRIFFVAGRNEHMPSVLSYINPYWNTPIPAVLFTGVLSMAYLLLSDNINTLITYIGIVNWLAIGAATAALLWLRISKPPELYPRPLEVHLIFPTVFFLGCVFLVVFPMFQSLKNSLIGLGLMLSGLPVYFLFVHRRFGRLDQIIDNFTLFTQKLLLVVPVGKKN